MSKIKKSLTISLLAVLLFAAVLPFSAVVFAETSVEGFDGSSIYDDLKDASILGKTFDINDYPVNENGTPELLAFVEFAFSLKHEYQPYYGLYLYVYYPQGNLVVDSELNNVEMANEYEGDEAVNWSKYTLKFLDKDYNGVLYKFKVLDSKAEPEHTIAETFGRVAMSSTKRRYDISGIELHQEGNVNAVEYGIGGTWTITGYSQGMHDSSAEQSTLESVATFQNTLRLDVHQTYYRAWRDMANMYGDQLSSVYFSVDNAIEENYDNLEAIKFDAYKYLSSPIFCINENYQFLENGLLVDYSKVYANLQKQMGLTMDQIRATYDDNFMESLDYTWLHWSTFIHGDDISCYYGHDSHTGKHCVDQLAWVFKSTSDNDNYITSEELAEHMDKFSEQFGRDVRKKYSSALFADYFYLQPELPAFNVANADHGIGDTIYCNDSGQLTGNLTRKTLWESLSYLFHNTENVETFDPIQEVTYDEIKALDKETISQEYLVNIHDVPEFIAYVKDQNSKNKSVYLFRFDVEYFTTVPLFCEDYGRCGYVAQEPIYLDFDIISLTYDKAGVQTVIPVVSNPIDIIAGIEPPGTDLLPDNADLVNLYMLVIIVLAIVLVGPLVLGALKFIFNVR